MLTHAPSTAPLAKSHSVDKGPSNQSINQRYKLCQREVEEGSSARNGSRKNKNRPLPMQLRKAIALRIRERIEKRRETGEGLAKTQLMASIKEIGETGIVARNL